MSDFLDSLVDRSLGVGQTLRPRLASRFEPVRAMPAPGFDGSERPESIHDELPAETASLSVPSASFADNPTRDQQSVDRLNSASSAPGIPPSPLQRFAADSSPAAVHIPGHAATHQDDLFGSRSRREASTERESPSDARWLHRRLDELAGQLQSWRGAEATGESAPAAIPALVAESPPTRSNSQPLATSDDQRNIDRQQFVVPHQDEEATPRLLSVPPKPQLQPDGSQSATSIHPMVQPLFANDDSLRGRSAASESQQHGNEPSQRPTPPAIAPRVEVTHPGSSVRDRQRATHEELLALLSSSQLRSLPKIVSEDLPAISKHSAPPQPTINVTIGRVEVKANREAPAAPRPAKPHGSSNVMTLADYLQRRAAGGAG